MYRIEEARFLGPGVKLFRIHAPRIAAKHQAGQFCILRVHERGERIPLTIAEGDPQTGLVTIIVQSIGKTTYLLNSLEAGDHILDIVGPLGKESEVAKYGTVVVIGGGVGTAIALPTARAMKKAGNHVIGIIGARNKDLMILESEMRSACSDGVLVCTDDGSYGAKGLVTDVLTSLIAAGKKPDLVLAIGPIPMMRAVAKTTAPLAIRTIVSLNSIMVDGTGMCGGCRVLVGNSSKFACVDGPEFDAHEVDFDVLTQRNRMYRDKEAASLAAFRNGPQHDFDIMRAAGQIGPAHEARGLEIPAAAASTVAVIGGGAR
jgi:ferredoxin/flavodoxin---NADP+ reductase